MRINIDPERLREAADREDGRILSVGGLVTDMERDRELERLRAEVALLERCVRHYADPANWGVGDSYDGEARWGIDVAEEALERLLGLRKSPASE